MKNNIVNYDKIFVCVVFHHSDLRPRGYEMAENFCNAWKNENIPYKLVVLDNESTCEYPCLEGINHDFIRVDNQLKAGGVVGAWNTLCQHAYDSGAEIITGFADDVQLNTTLFNLIEKTINDDIIYAPLTDGLMYLNETSKTHYWGNQYSFSVKPKYFKQVNSINGFWMSFTRKFWETRQIKGELFPLNFPGLTKWAGQEEVINKWIQDLKHTEAWIVGDCWIHHTKLRSWVNADRKFKGM